MYTPAFNSVEEETAIRAMVSAIGSAQFVTVDDDGFPTATLLPIIWERDTVIAHIARANPQWGTVADGSPALLICAGPQAYISPSWYAAKYEHGRVVPTWNYTAVHLTGTVRVHHDADWLHQAVDRLTITHEGPRELPWQVTDAPEAFIQGQLRGIVGLEITVTRVEGKAKLSQNRSAADRRGVVEGLRGEAAVGAEAVASEMERAMATGLSE
ncbi:FMN-binding negative transcriptional regulator [Mycolicibacterium komossense]|uniref:FMN-binding negative transcriptional regulator n=1 Tax=Mycolicibacterium komossense TaxID=1779 RepID=A0ABT3CIK4_9MYCO|nr:FMN-binding negative transcriptional regulator [Mycolicibacterium komossense]MCV7229158.1 FMN-binding negative transcriptional regulator [Mycolicibacterium komossense]